MAYLYLDVIKQTARSIYPDLSLSEAYERAARVGGFSTYHEMQTLARHNPLDPRLGTYAFGPDWESNVVYMDNIYRELDLAVENEVAGTIADMNATMFMIENLDVASSSYDPDTGILISNVSFEYTGEPDIDRPYSGHSLALTGKLWTRWRSGQWELADQGFEVTDESASSDELFSEDVDSGFNGEWKMGIVGYVDLVNSDGDELRVGAGEFSPEQDGSDGSVLYIYWNSGLELRVTWVPGSPPSTTSVEILEGDFDITDDQIMAVEEDPDPWDDD
ncbi:hypothetical protein [Marinobacterium mangrovicola]|uniref:Uncharacterized protein n=1 Tax=Marinobacterium mangrovicola TaxID=1476959 RepID=A0A4R1G8S9_9GAMM|nr:hypothetical protein [Marinobacterium mangrovicola]TCK02980.1 hypothetical protein CLV83_4033 [Marinobacterium mangrovicola]